MRNNPDLTKTYKIHRKYILIIIICFLSLLLLCSCNTDKTVSSFESENSTVTLSRGSGSNSSKAITDNNSEDNRIESEISNIESSMEESKEISIDSTASISEAGSLESDIRTSQISSEQSKEAEGTTSPTVVPTPILDKGIFETVGLYVWDDNPGQYEFWKACGINTLVFCDRGWWYNAQGIDEYLSKLTQWVNSAQKAGFKVYIILFSNIEQYMGPAAFEPTGLGVKFHPDNEIKLAERMYYIEKTIKATKNADGFTLFAGDPGGITNTMGQGGTQPFIKFAFKVKELLQLNAPNAQFNINTWAISYWHTPNQSAELATFWLNETTMTKELLQNQSLFDLNTGIEFPTHDYYRPLALRSYKNQMIDSGLLDDYPLYPLKSDIDILKLRGIKNLWAWPYFLLDEADDGDPGGVLRTNLPQIELRYINDYLNQMRNIGMNGVIGNWSYSGFKNKSLNTYAFGRFANDDEATVEEVIHEYASFIATADTTKTLVKILKYIENESNWQQKLPVEKRLIDFDIEITSSNHALSLLETVIPVEKPAIPLPIKPGIYLSNLKLRLELIK